MMTEALVVTRHGEVCSFGLAAPSGVIRRLVGGVVNPYGFHVQLLPPGKALVSRAAVLWERLAGTEA